MRKLLLLYVYMDSVTWSYNSVQVLNVSDMLRTVLM